MIAALRNRYARFRGFDVDGRVVPAMDGPLSPNTYLDEARRLGRFPDIDNLMQAGGHLLASQGNALISVLPNGTAETIARFESPIASLAQSPDGGLAIGLDGQGIRIRGGRHDGVTITMLDGQPLRCPTALCFESADTLLIAHGSGVSLAADWQRDLMTLGRSGSLWRLSLGGGATKCVAQDLAFPSGIAPDGAGGLFLSEAWAHRVLHLSANGARRVALDQLPAYPGRIAAGTDGFWLALFAPRNQLVEFVLAEPDFRQRMVHEVDPALWVVPSLRAGPILGSPLQAGAVRKLGTLKPWSPSWSYGLVLRCDAMMRPLASYHSRADGSVHGVTALAPMGDTVLIAAKGSGLLLQLDPQASGQRG